MKFVNFSGNEKEEFVGFVGTVDASPTSRETKRSAEPPRQSDQ